MNNQSNSRVLGAFLIGFAIVAGTYLINTFNRPIVSAPENVHAVAEAPLRIAIDVKDSNDDGVEDWREEFVKTAPIITTTSADDYELPDTLTAQVSLTFMERILSSKTRGVLGVSQEKIIDDTVTSLKSQEEDRIYSVKDIILSKDNSDEAVHRYGNAVALAILENNVSGLRNELVIMESIVNSQTPNENDLEELKLRAEVFKNTRDATLNIPVPKIFVKEHLDLINVYNAMHHTITSIAVYNTDPVRTLLRLKRYEEDSSGLILALENMYTVLDAHPFQFAEDDPALYFVIFSPNFNKP